MKARLRFHGAAQEVTGSMHLVEVNGRTIALDCGLFQGRRREANARNRSFPCPPDRIDAVILSHALDGGAIADPLDPHESWRLIVFVSAAAMRLVAPIFLIVWTAAALAPAPSFKNIRRLSLLCSILRDPPRV